MPRSIPVVATTQFTPQIYGDARFPGATTALVSIQKNVRFPEHHLEPFRSDVKTPVRSPSTMGRHRPEQWLPPGAMSGFRLDQEHTIEPSLPVLPYCYFIHVSHLRPVLVGPGLAQDILVPWSISHNGSRNIRTAFFIMRPRSSPVSDYCR